MHGVHIKITEAQQAKIYISKNTKAEVIKYKRRHLVQQNVQIHTINAQIKERLYVI
jgi:hypothetical protein